MATRYSSALISLGTPMIMPGSFLGSRFILGRMAKRIKVNSLARPLAFPCKMRSSIAIAKESDMKHLLLAAAAIALLAPGGSSVAIREKPVKESDSVVVMETSLGTIKIELLKDKAP